MSRSWRRIGLVAWPAFLSAAVLEMAVFAVVDPLSLHGLGGGALDVSPLTVYSLAFFGFWATVSAACALSLLLSRSARDINRSH